MLRLRLTRTGKKHAPTYRLVVCEHTAPIKGKFIENLGYYLPVQSGKPLVIKEDRVKYWLSKGARPSDTVCNLLVDQKILTDKRNIRYAKTTTKPESSTPAPVVEEPAA